MTYRNGNYCAFYVDEPFNPSNLGAYATPDFIYYNTLRMWKGGNPNFPFNDSHSKTYSVRDDSDWETTLKPRLHMRLNNSKNIILFFSSITRNSRALKEEMDYGIGKLKLPVIVVYPDYQDYSLMLDCNGNFRDYISRMWDKLPSFKNNKDLVPTLHIPWNKATIESALNNQDFMINTKCKSGLYRQNR